MRHRWAWTHRHAVPMFVSSLVAVILSGSGLIAVLVFADGDGSGAETENCVVGAWQLTGYTEEVSGVGSSELVTGSPTFTFDADGSGTATYRDGTAMRTQAFGVEADVTVSGPINFRYQTSGETLEFVEQRSSASMDSDLELPGLPIPDTYTLPEGPLSYTCDGDALSLTGPQNTFEYERAG